MENVNYDTRPKSVLSLGKYQARKSLSVMEKRWYRVKAVFAGRVIDGYINELALLGKSIKKY